MPPTRMSLAIAASTIIALVALVGSGCERPAQNDATEPASAGAPSGAGGSAAGAAGTRRPDVLLISIDSLRADHVGALGYDEPTTPEIDALAAEGASFANAISTSSWTLPAHAALLTGLWDSAHGVVTPKDRLADSIVTLAEAFSAGGYRTVGFYSGPFLDPGFGLAQGYERYVDCTSYARTAHAMPIAKRHAQSHEDRTNPAVLWNVLHELATAVNAQETARGEKRDRRAGESRDGSDDRPFFFFVHMWDVHYDLIAPLEFVRAFAETGEGTAVEARDAYDGHDYRHDARFKPGVDDELFRRVLALYDAEIRYTDATIGLIVDTLRRSGRLDDTIVVVTSDHGDEFLDHGGKGHRHTLFQELIRVPLVVRWPGRVARARIEAPVSLTDVAPTLLELAGLPPLAESSGRSLAGALRSGREPSSRPVMAELWQGRGRSSAALVEGTHKVIVGDRRGPAFYDLAADPHEREPLAAESTERGRALIARLDEMRTRARALHAQLGGGARATHGPAMRSRLRALGYLD